MKTILFTNDWETYYASIDEKLNLIKLDLQANEFKEEYIHSLFIRLDFNLDAEWPNESENQIIVRYLEHLEAALISYQYDLKYIGSIQNNEQIDLIFVAKEMYDFSEFFTKIFTKHPFQFSWLKDDHFKIYNELLYPTDLDLIYIYNRNLLKDYYSQFSEEKHLIYQYLVFHTREDAQNFITEVYKDFKVLDTILTKDKMYIVQLVKEEDMTFIDLNASSLELYQKAKTHNGNYIYCHYKSINNGVDA